MTHNYFDNISKLLGDKTTPLDYVGFTIERSAP